MLIHHFDDGTSKVMLKNLGLLRGTTPWHHCMCEKPSLIMILEIEKLGYIGPHSMLVGLALGLIGPLVSIF